MGVYFKGYTDITKTLIENNVSAQNYNGATALIYASTFGYTAIVMFLLANNADVSLTDNRGNTEIIALLKR